jgi:hypothetical protein
MRIFGNAFDVLRLLRDPRMLLLVLILVTSLNHRSPAHFLIHQISVCVYSGMEQSFMSGDFTSDIIKKAIGVNFIGSLCLAPSFGTVLIAFALQLGFIMCVYGAFDAAASVLLGKAADIVGKKCVPPSPAIASV